ncbi:MAG: alpha/beta fold hydrolase [Hyphomonadaceae bacterium]|nr:alpha/beta fold hydrolase [Hyphomonadaceae bacterium]
MPRLDHAPRARSGQPDWSRDGGDWPNRNCSEFWYVDGTTWHLQRRGTGPLALLLHGTGAATHSWSPLIPELEQKFEVLAVDLPGHGFTQVRRGFQPSLPGMAAELLALMKELDAAPSTIVGHSAGAAIALYVAARRQMRPDTLVSINGAFEPFSGLMRWIAPLTAKAATMGGLAAWMVSRNSAGPEGVRSLIENVGSDPDAVDARPYSVLMRQRGHIQGALRMMANWNVSSLMLDCSKVSIPALFIAGAQDRAVPPEVSERAAGRTQNGTYLEFDKLGHLAHEEAPELVAAAIKDHWDRSKAP